MRNVVLYMQSTINGYAIGPDEEMDWLTVTDQTWELVGKLQEQCDTALIGGVTYREFVDFWPTAADDSGHPEGLRSHSRWLTDSQKVVFSSTLQDPGWRNARVVAADLPGEIARMQKEPGKDLLLLGGPGLVRSFSEADLIDEYWILLNPGSMGGGKTLLSTRKTVRLLEAKPFDSGVVALHYGRV